MHSHGASRRVAIPRGILRRGRSGTPDGPCRGNAVIDEWRPAQPVDAAFALSRAEADALREVLEPACGPRDRSFDGRSGDALHARLGLDRRWSVSPDSLRAGIEATLAEARNGGRVEVLRLPGALRSPEMWHVRLVGVQPEAAQRVEAAVRFVRRGGADVR